MIICNIKAGAVIALLCLKTVFAGNAVYNARAIVEFWWKSDDDATLMTTKQMYQFQNAAAMYFGEILGAEHKDDGLLSNQQALTTRVTVADQNLELGPTGEYMQFRLPSTLDFTYVGSEEITSLATILDTVTKDKEESALFYNLKSLAGHADFFEMIFSDPALDKSTTMLSIDDGTVIVERAADKASVGLIVSCTLAGVALFCAALILLWALGCFNKSVTLKDITRSWSGSQSTSKKPYGHKSRDVESQDDGSGKVGAEPRENEENVPPAGNQNMTSPKRGVYPEEADAMMSPMSQTSEVTNFTADTSKAPLGISSIRKLKRSSLSSTSNQATLTSVELTMS